MVRRLMQDPEGFYCFAWFFFCCFVLTICKKQGNKAKLLQITQANAGKLLQAQQNWEPKRVALIEGYRAEKDKFEGRKLAAQGLLREIDEMRAKAKELAADVQQKDQRYRNLLEGFVWKCVGSVLCF
jgi:predicted RNA-binding protein YlxR (DUF448 family)